MKNYSKTFSDKSDGFWKLRSLKNFQKTKFCTFLRCKFQLFWQKMKFLKVLKLNFLKNNFIYFVTRSRGQKVHKVFLVKHQQLFSKSVAAGVCGHPRLVWYMILKKKVTWFLCKKKPLFWSCSWRFIFIYSRTKKRVIVISDSNYTKRNVGFVQNYTNCYQIWETPSFGPAVDKNKPSTARPKKWFFFCTAKVILSVDLFF